MNNRRTQAALFSADASHPLQRLTSRQREELVPEIVALAHKAGEAIMSIYRSGDAGTTTKTDNSPLTIADLASHLIIVDGLKNLEPDLPILSEEAACIPYTERKLWTCYWLVDPLDGTKEFIKHNGEFTVNIALIENGEPVIGVVYAPALDVCYHAARGTGAFVQRENGAAQPIKTNSHQAGQAIKVAASRSHSDARTEALLEQIGDHECISMGSSLKLCLVAEGQAHIYPRLGPTMEWDTAAAHVIVNEAGGAVCDSGGLELRYNKADLHNPEFFVFPAEDEVLRELLKIARCVPDGI